MEKGEKYDLQEFIDELSVINFSDSLVNVNFGNKSIFISDSHFEENFQIPFSPSINQLIKIAQNFKKTSDIQSLCLSTSLLSWKIKDREIQTPILLFPLNFKINKVKQIFEFSRNDAFLNPVIIKILKDEFNLSFENKHVFSNEFIDVIEELIDFLEENEINFSVLEKGIIGNFHHHRFEIIKDLEEISTHKSHNHLLDILLGKIEEENSECIEISSNNCFGTDLNQEEIALALKNQNLVLQGPPGTGKSQVIANLLSKLLLNDTKQLLVSEKKTALQVIKNKLETLDLGHFAFVFHSQNKNSDFVTFLQNTWAFLDSKKMEENKNLYLSEQVKDRLQLIFDKLNQTKEFGSKSLSELQFLSEQKKFKDLPFISNLPNYTDFKNQQSAFVTIFETIEKPYLLSKIALPVYKNIENFDLIIQEQIDFLNSINVVVKTTSLAELNNLQKKHSRIQLLENEKNKEYLKILQSKVKLKNYRKLKSNYLKLQNELGLFENELKSWNYIPSKSEIESHLSLLKNGTWLQKRKVRKQVLKLHKLHNIDVELVLNRLLDFKNSENILVEIKNAFIDLGIENPEYELNLADYIIKQFESSEENELNELSHYSKEELNFITSNFEKVIKLEKNLSSYFLFKNEDNLVQILHELKANLTSIIQSKHLLIDFSAQILSSFQFAENFDELELLILKSNWVKFCAQFPELSIFTGQKLSSLLDELIQLEKSENKHFASVIISKRKRKFDEFHNLLNSNTAKLSVSDKELKKSLRIGKSILVKEFSKSKQHKSFRELYASEAKIWIDLLCPLHLSSPLMVSRNYTLEKNQFECILFDEASQIILPKALSCVQRAKRLLVAGDSQQMSPSSFFAGKINSVDLLHQASFYLPNFSLKHHYRSIHSELIDFSNRHFYKNELIVYPSAIKTYKPIEFHYINDARFINRENNLEAKELVSILIPLLKTDKRIGVVAFSEQQISCIIKNISTSYLDSIQEKINEGYLFFKSLEQIQGDECDVLLISLAYGRDENGKFHHRFGPLNQDGGSKRLNVLFTRSKEKIHFFSSVSSSDFQLSNNEAVNLLANYIRSIEKNEEVQFNFKFPHTIDYQINKNKLLIHHIQKNIPLIDDLKVFHKVMKQRFWVLEYVI